MQTTIPLYGFGGGTGGTGASLTITAPAGATVTVSKDGKSKTKVADSSGVAVFKGLGTGAWTVTITDGEQTAQKTVTVTADYSTSIAFFAAVINVTYPAGSTCTATDGVTTLRSDTSGTWAFVVPNAGTWTIRVVDNGWEEAVEITDNGQSEQVYLDGLYLFKDGNSYESRTGGWTASGWTNSARTLGGTATINETLNLGVTVATTFSALGTAKQIDLTDFNTISADGSSTGNGYMTLSVSQTKQVDSGYEAQNSYNPSLGSVSLDVSSLSGKWYVIVYQINALKADTRTTKYTRIWME